MARMNARWHAKHPMPVKPTVEQRIRWHRAHQKHCACRPIPPKLRRLLAPSARPERECAEKVNIAEKLALFRDHWNPRIVAELNGQQVKVVKFDGPFVWHRHENEDELFLVVRGSFRMEFRERSVELGEGELIVVPRGVEHRPVAEHEVEVLLFEPSSTLNTGNVRNERTVVEPQRV